MPALQKPPARLPRFVPHVDSGAKPGAGTEAGRRAGTFLKPASTALVPSPKTTLLRSESLERLAHDARNILSSLMLYSDLLSASGVLGPGHGHFAPELESMTRTAARLMESILEQALPSHPSPATLPIALPAPLPAVPVTDLAAELRHLQPLLAAIASPAVKLSIAAMPCARRTRLAVEDLARILVNLVRNAADAMPSGGHVRITAQYSKDHSFLDSENVIAFGLPRSVLLTVSDSGPGIPAHLQEKVFDIGFTTRTTQSACGRPAPRRRGLGLSTVRHLVESAGGTVRLLPAQTGIGTFGASFEISLPLVHPIGETITSGTYPTLFQGANAADSAMKGRLECL